MAGVILAGTLIVLIMFSMDDGRVFRSIPKIPSGCVLTVVGCAYVAIPSIILFTLRMIPNSILAAAWIAGFLTPAAPAGVGVRETVIAVGLTPVYDEATAVGLAVVLHVISTIGDGLGFAVALLLKRKLDYSTNHISDVSP